MIIIPYEGREITITKKQAAKIADMAELVEIETPGGKEYISLKNIAAITGGGDHTQIEKMKQIEAKRPK